jgi:molybdopterin-guanine dinucleotide biosynthesis protein A
LNRLFGLVLAGGMSTRFGAEKAAALLDGKPLLVHARAALAGCSRVAVSAEAGSEAERLARDHGLAVVYDAPGHARGPLAGVAAGLAWGRDLGAERLALAPCDTPRMTAAMVGRMDRALRPADLIAAALTEDGLHALCAVLRISALDPIAEAMADGAHPPVRSLWRAIGLREIRFDDASAFANVNRPEDLDRLA